MGDIRERTAVNERRRAFQRLHQVRLEGVLEKRRHCAHRVQLAGRHRFVVVRVADYNSGKSLFQVGNGIREAEHRHDLRSHRNVEAVLPRDAVGPAAAAVHNEAELAVVHVHAALPGDLARVDAEGVPLVNVVVQHCRQQVVRGTDGVKVAREVKVDVLHGHHLRVAASGSAAFDSENGSQRGFAQRHRHLFADAGQSVREAYRCGGLALTRRRGRYRGDQNELPVRPVRLLEKLRVDFGLVAAVLFHVLFGNACLLRNPADVLKFCALSDLDIRQITHFQFTLLSFFTPRFQKLPRL